MATRIARASLVGLVVILGSIPAAEAACISGGSGSKIQDALQNPGDVARLCQGAVFDVITTIQFTKPDQVIRTAGTATGDARALLRAVPPLATVIDGRGKSGVQVLRLRIDGRRGGASREGGALIRIGGNNASNQQVSRTRAWDPRGWSVLHVAEGPGNSCSQAMITNNELGPAGHEAQDQWADGVSLACRDSLVAGNLITDVTDGGIVIFGAPGSLVENNTVLATARTLLGGINLVDFAPWAGDYTGVRVRSNSIVAQGAFIKTGIAMGTRVWSCPPFSEQPNRGAVVTNNILSGSPIGYGFVVDGVADWTVTGNQSSAIVGGIGTPGCDGNNAAPTAFLRHFAHSSGTFQPEFVEGVTHYALGVRPF